MNASIKRIVLRMSSNLSRDVGEWIYRQGTDTTELGTPSREI